MSGYKKKDGMGTHAVMVILIGPAISEMLAELFQFLFQPGQLVLVCQ